MPTRVLTEDDWRNILHDDFGPLVVYTDGQMVLHGKLVEGYGVRLVAPDGAVVTPWEVYAWKKQAGDRAHELDLFVKEGRTR